MNQIYKYLSSSGVIFYNSMQRATKKRVFEEACLAFQMSGVPHTQVFEALYARERLGNNALGAGVALPHCELEGLTRPMVTIVILQRPIHVDPTPYDNKPVDIFFFLIVPKTEDDDDRYLPLLRECIAMLEDKKLCAQIRNSGNAVEVCSCITDWAAPTILARESKEDALENEWDILNEEVKAERKVEQGEHRLTVAAVENNA